MQATAGLALRQQGLELVTFGLGAEVPFLGAFCNWSIRWVDLAALDTKLSRHLLCLPNCCRRIKKGAGDFK